MAGPDRSLGHREHWALGIGAPEPDTEALARRIDRRQFAETWSDPRSAQSVSQQQCCVSAHPSVLANENAAGFGRTER